MNSALRIDVGILSLAAEPDLAFSKLERSPAHDKTYDLATIWIQNTTVIYIHEWTEMFTCGNSWIGLFPSLPSLADDGYLTTEIWNGSCQGNPVGSAPVTGFASPAQSEYQFRPSLIGSLVRKRPVEESECRRPRSLSPDESSW